MILYYDKQFGFYELFNEDNGTLIRSDINGVDPYMRSFPELLDVGIMGHCSNGVYCSAAGVDCYQRGKDNYREHMTVDDFETIARQASGKTFQIALGGAGDPNKHPGFEEILRICRHYHIVPNITTSGFHLTEKEISLIRRYCGAVAVSWYSRLIEGKESNCATINAVKRFLSAGCTTNIHFVVSKDTIDEAIERLQADRFCEGINAVVFILYKPVGLGRSEKVLSADDSRLDLFFANALLRHPYQVGFDTCFTPAVLHWCKDISPASVDACEAATFSMYIDSNLYCYPCSFGIWDSPEQISLKEFSLREVWNSEFFSRYRNHNDKKCRACTFLRLCRSGCRLGLDYCLCAE